MNRTQCQALPYQESLVTMNFMLVNLPVMSLTWERMFSNPNKIYTPGNGPRSSRYLKTDLIIIDFHSYDDKSFSSFLFVLTLNIFQLQTVKRLKLPL